MGVRIVERLGEVVATLSDPECASELACLDGDELVDVIALAEKLSAVAGAVQGHAEQELRAQQIAAQKRAGVPARALGKGVAEQIALARRITPTQAGNQTALRRVLIDSMPRTLALWQVGEISTWAAHEVAKKVLVLDDEDRATIDEEFAPRLPELTASRVGRLVGARADQLDGDAAVARMTRNVASRRVWTRPAGDGVSQISALLPTVDAVAAYAALDQEATVRRAEGDARPRGAIMADTLAQRATGARTPDEVGIEIQLLMTDTTLLADGDEPAWIDGHPIPGPIARHLALGLPGRANPTRPRSTSPARTRTSTAAASRTGATDGAAAPAGTAVVDAPSAATTATARSDAPADAATGPGGSRGDPESGACCDPAAQQTRVAIDRAKRSIRRLFTDPRSGQLVGMDPRRRVFTGAVRRFILARDQECRTPWCTAPIRDIHHVTRYADGGPTTPRNGVGVCSRANQVFELPGWATETITDPDGGPAILRTTTPTGHTYDSAPPPQNPAGPQHPARPGAADRADSTEMTSSTSATG